MTALNILTAFLFTIATANALCCPRCPNPFSGHCGDGTRCGLGNGNFCCATHTCNVACCDCGGSCRSALSASARILTKFFPESVIARASAMSLDEVLAYFNSYDTDLSDGINNSEFVKKTGLDNLAFADLDKNGDQIVQLDEFDADAAREKREREL